MTADSQNSRLYSVSLFFESLRNNVRAEENLWEESIVLVAAQDLDEARAKAQAIGESRTSTFQTIDGTEVRWLLAHVGQIFEIDEPSLADGTEIFSRHLRRSEVDSLTRPFGD